jgi:hypothetical protein
MKKWIDGPSITGVPINPISVLEFLPVPIFSPKIVNEFWRQTPNFQLIEIQGNPLPGVCEIAAAKQWFTNEFIFLLTPSPA